MIPALVGGVLPPGVHEANRQEAAAAFGLPAHRRLLLAGFQRGVAALRRAGCTDVWLNGSYVTDKAIPNDYDACWDPLGVDLNKLDPVLQDLGRQRVAQKVKFGGEFFPNIVEAASGLLFIEFWQRDREGNQKGILHIDTEEWA